MASVGPDVSLTDFISSFLRSSSHYEQFYEPYTSRREPSGPEADLSTSENSLEAFERAFGSDPINRMFASSVGTKAWKIIGNERQTFELLSEISVDIMLRQYLKRRLKEPKDCQPVLKRRERALFVAGGRDRPPTLLILNPSIKDLSQTQRLTNAFSLVDEWPSIEKMYRRLRLPPKSHAVVSSIFSQGPSGLVETFGITRPEVIRTRRPRMVPMCIPQPHLAVECNGMRSTAGVLCRDRDGELGITACYHATGPTGTQVTIGLKTLTVKAYSQVQDLVFVPVGEGYNFPPMRAVERLLDDRAPAVADQASFEGSTSGPVDTWIQSHDAGILRLRPSLQLKFQTPPDTNQGDSGCALVNKYRELMGFAFERTDINERLQFSDWIWAANALFALGLTPIEMPAI